jgi:hypothetical protein
MSEIFRLATLPLSIIIIIHIYIWGSYFIDDATIPCQQACPKGQSYECIGMNRCERIITELSSLQWLCILIAIYTGYSASKSNLLLFERTVLLLLSPVLFDFVLRIAVAQWLIIQPVLTAFGMVLAANISFLFFEHKIS